VVTYRGLGFDPAPGSVDAVAQTIAQLRAAADALASVEPAVRTAARHTASWQGAAADAFRAQVPAADVSRLRAAVPVLERWAETLAANKRRTEDLDARALRARRALDDARDALQDRQNALDLASTPVTAASASVEVSAATERVATAESALQEVLSEARDLERAHQRAADEVAAALDTGAEPEGDRPAIRALAGVLNRSSRVSASLAALIAPGTFTTPPAGAMAAVAAAQPLRGTGELMVLGETPLSES
jgi:chromosome segregation ATPase